MLERVTYYEIFNKIVYMTGLLSGKNEVDKILWNKLSHSQS